MNKQEFETLSKITVTPEEYAAIEKIYMNAGEMDKQEFCKAYKASTKSDSLNLVEALSNEVTSRGNQIKTLKREKEAILQDLDKEAETSMKLERELGEMRAKADDLKKKLDTATVQKDYLALQLLTAGLDEQAIAILGHKYVIALKCEHVMELSKSDRNFLAKAFKEQDQ